MGLSETTVVLNEHQDGTTITDLHLLLNPTHPDDAMSLTERVSRASYDDPLHTIITSLADYCFREHRLLPHEFVGMIDKQRIPELLVSHFIADSDTSFPYEETPEGTDLAEQLEEIAFLKNSILGYLEQFSSNRSQMTLFQYLKSRQSLVPSVNISAVLREPDVSAAIKNAVRVLAPKIAEDKFTQLFESSPLRFIHQYLFSRVIRIDEAGIPSVDSETLIPLIKFLRSQHFEIEHIYMLLYSRIGKLSRVFSKQQVIRRRVQKASPSLQVDDNGDVQNEKSLFSPHFDFDRFFGKRIAPAIQESRDKEFEPLTTLRLFDILSFGDAHALRKTIFPARAQTVLGEKARLSDEGADEFLMTFFNYTDAPEAPDIGIDEAKREVGKHLGLVEKQIRYITSKALLMLPEEHPARNDCSFIPELLSCRDPVQLLRWLVTPADFIKDFPDYAELPYKVIKHQAQFMLRLLLFIRKHAFLPQHKKGEKQRNQVQSYFSKRLGIKKDKTFAMVSGFRTVINNRTQEESIITPEHELFESGDTTVTIDGDSCTLYPKETKRFLNITMNIPTRNGIHTCCALVYSPDGKIVHKKELESIISSYLRGKEPTDDIRWTLIFENDKDETAFKDFLYEAHSSGLKITDNKEGRQTRDAQRSSAGSATFSNARDLSAALYCTLPFRKKSDGSAPSAGDLDYDHIMFETQILNLNAFLLASSDFTSTSHSKTYTPEREWKNMFGYLFPPHIYGQKFADYFFAGYRGDNGATVEDYINGNGTKKK